jgi:hypothetical protein
MKFEGVRKRDISGTATGTEKKVVKFLNEDGELKQTQKTQGIAYPLPKRLYTLKEAAHYLGRTLWSMRELIWKGSIPIVREKKRIFIDIQDLESYVMRHKTTLT